MLILKTDTDVRKMRLAGKIAGGALMAAKAAIAPGVSTWELDKIIESYIRSHGAIPSFKGYGGFPGSACISINNVVIHGIPSKKILLQEGDIVSVDVGAYIDGFHGDTAKTFAVGDISAEAARLMEVTENSLGEVMKLLREGVRLGDIGNAVDSYVTGFGYTTVKDFVGHGVGRALHEDPSIPNYGTPGRGLRLMKGTTVAIEPMVNAGVEDVIVDNHDGWTVRTADGKLSAHFEHTFYIDKEGFVILTDPEDN
ncbi:MAG: type I methionyl aminopeptidase [Clostridia bacterium]|nr:type I methionyl aminopeptidase [Clostridia bacterium]